MGQPPCSAPETLPARSRPEHTIRASTTSLLHRASSALHLPSCILRSESSRVSTPIRRGISGVSRWARSVEEKKPSAVTPCAATMSSGGQASGGPRHHLAGAAPAIACKPMFQHRLTTKQPVRVLEVFDRSRTIRADDGQLVPRADLAHLAADPIAGSFKPVAHAPLRGKRRHSAIARRNVQLTDSDVTKRDSRPTKPAPGPCAKRSRMAPVRHS